MVKNRNVQFPTRYQLNKIYDNENIYDIIPKYGEVYEEGTQINADLFNDLENQISSKANLVHNHNYKKLETFEYYQSGDISGVPFELGIGSYRISLRGSGSWAEGSRSFTLQLGYKNCWNVSDDNNFCNNATLYLAYKNYKYYLKILWNNLSPNKESINRVQLSVESPNYIAKNPSIPDDANFTKILAEDTSIPQLIPSQSDLNNIIPYSNNAYYYMPYGSKALTLINKPFSESYGMYMEVRQSRRTTENDSFVQTLYNQMNSNGKLWTDVYERTVWKNKTGQSNVEVGPWLHVRGMNRWKKIFDGCISNGQTVNVANLSNYNLLKVRVGTSSEDFFVAITLENIDNIYRGCNGYSTSNCIVMTAIQARVNGDSFKLESLHDQRHYDGNTLTLGETCKVREIWGLV